MSRVCKMRRKSGRPKPNWVGYATASLVFSRKFAVLKGGGGEGRIVLLKKWLIASWNILDIPCRPPFLCVVGAVE